MAKENLVKIIIVVIAICAVGAIWLYKNKEKNVSNDLYEVNFEIDETFNLEELKKNGVPIVLNFSATWCGTCQQFNPIIKEVAKENKDKVIIKDIDVDKYTELSNFYNIIYLPTQVLINSNGEPYKASHAGDFEYYNDEKGKHVYTNHIGMFSKEGLIDILKEMGMND